MSGPGPKRDNGESAARATDLLGGTAPRARIGRRGRLKVFLGAASGVGKTQAMLKSALAKKQGGVEVVIGLVDSHGRSDTGALALEFESVPLRVLEQNGRLYRELNVGAILARRPQLVLVDDLHRHRVGSRGDTQRYHDIDVLLAAGIDVYTTLNVQHLESLNEHVAEVTGYRETATVPDRVIDEADEVELVDLAPEDLIRRLRAGQIRLAPSIRRGSSDFYSRESLNALRNMALRQTARRIERRGVAAGRIAAERAWAATRRILLGIAADASAEHLVHAVNRIAVRNNASWIAVHVETPRERSLPEIDRERLRRALALARELGGGTAVVRGDRVAHELLRAARVNHASQVIVGRSRRSAVSRLLRPATAQMLVEMSEEIEVSVVHTPRPMGRAGSPLGELVGPSTRATRSYLLTAAGVMGAAVLAKLVENYVAPANLMLILLAPVLYSAVRFGFAPAALAAAAAVLSYNFLFVWPDLAIKPNAGSFQDILTFAIFLIAAGLTSHLAGRARDRELATRDRGRIAEALLRLSREIAAAVKPSEVMQVIVAKADEVLDARTVFLAPDRGEERLELAAPAGAEIGEVDWAAAHWCFQNEQPSGRETAAFPGAQRHYLPIATGEGVLGVLGIAWNAPDSGRGAHIGLVIDGIVRQAAVALERARLSERMEDARFLSESESLRAALLSSISHDLRTPLASIIGAASSLVRYGRGFDDTTREDLVQTIHEEADRLNRFVGNLLDMTKLEAGALAPQLKWEDLSDLIGAAIESQKIRIRGDRFRVDLEPGLPMLAIDFVLMEQVLINLFDNAHKYSSPNAPIRVRATKSGTEVLIEVADQGIGIPGEELSRIFDKFYRVRDMDRKVAGTGLGLAICKGIVEAHGGSISAASDGPGRGARFTIRLPAESEGPFVQLEEASDA